MSTAELKTKLIAEIKEINNEELLKEVYRLLEIEHEDSLPYIFTDEQVTMVNEALEDVNAGRTLTEEEANKRTDKWLGK